jgi:hypothetical protein
MESILAINRGRPGSSLVGAFMVVGQMLHLLRVNWGIDVIWPRTLFGISRPIKARRSLRLSLVIIRQKQGQGAPQCVPSRKEAEVWRHASVVRSGRRRKENPGENPPLCPGPEAACRVPSSNVLACQKSSWPSPGQERSLSLQSHDVSKR